MKWIASCFAGSVVALSLLTLGCEGRDAGLNGDGGEVIEPADPDLNDPNGAIEEEPATDLP